MNAFTLDPADRTLLLTSCGVKKQINWFLLIAGAFAIVMSAGEWVDAWQRRTTAIEAATDAVEMAEIAQAPLSNPPIETADEPSGAAEDIRGDDAQLAPAEPEGPPAWTSAPQALETPPIASSAPISALSEPGFKSLSTPASPAPAVVTMERLPEAPKKVEKSPAPSTPRTPIPAMAKQVPADPCARIALAGQVPISKSGIRKLDSGSAQFSNGCIARPGGALGSSRIISIDAGSLSIRTTHGTIHFIDDGV